MDIKFLLFILAGLAGGFLGGMGMGGGTVLIPILTIFLKCNSHLSQAVNLISFIPMAAIALILHFKNGLIEKKGVLFIIIPAVAFAIIGSIVSASLKGEVLSRIFGGFLLCLSVVQFFSDKIAKSQK